MHEINSRHIYVCLIWFAFIVAILSPMYLSLSCSSPQTSKTTLIVDEDSKNSKKHDIHTDIEQQARDSAMRSATRTATIGFSPSLEMKENADFLLTPALLMQEALSDEVITTYPSE